jgi:NitT/TauT family transport system substrate-binding protein
MGLIAALLTPAHGADKVTFATNWLAEPEHGGFYQALADGTYARHGLDVTIQQGGPQANGRLLLAAGRIQFYMGANVLQAFDAVAQNVPTQIVASAFQKDPIILMSHPGQGLDRFEDLKTASAAWVSRENLVSVYQWLRKAHGFREENARSYAFVSTPFIADKKSVQQGYVTSEPFEIAGRGGFTPNVFLLADHGYESYSTTIEARRDLIAQNPDLVRRFVEASMIGWRNYLHGDNAAANALIKRENPEMSDAQIAWSIGKMKEHGIVESGDALTLGIGAMTEARFGRFFQSMVEAGVVKADLDWRKAFTLAFVGKGAGAAPQPPK